MAGGCYKSCELCSGKIYYDADLSYDYDRSEYTGCGQSKALCKKCYEYWELKVFKKDKEIK